MLIVPYGGGGGVQVITCTVWSTVKKFQNQTLRLGYFRPILKESKVFKRTGKKKIF
jgi:hypothetical protein